MCVILPTCLSVSLSVLLHLSISASPSLSLFSLSMYVCVCVCAHVSLSLSDVSLFVSFCVCVSLCFSLFLCICSYLLTCRRTFVCCRGGVWSPPVLMKILLLLSIVCAIKLLNGNLTYCRCFLHSNEFHRNLLLHFQLPLTQFMASSSPLWTSPSASNSSRQSRVPKWDIRS